MSVRDRIIAWMGPGFLHENKRYYIYKKSCKNKDFVLYFEKVYNKSWGPIAIISKKEYPEVYSLIDYKFCYPNHKFHITKKSKFDLLFFNRKFKPIIETFLKTDLIT
ncbi:MAG TPA: hypothetical protein VMX17_10345 [Candidatus Glassbacteria bacterium]|nr:hypothetical protein [Candidatus Glassbacteria bacterium]